MYNVEIQETWVKERLEGEYNRGRVNFTLVTELPFVPVIGMHWEDEEKAINLPVTNLIWNGDTNKFIIRHHVSNANPEELSNFIEDAKKAGWEVAER